MVRTTLVSSDYNPLRLTWALGDVGRGAAERRQSKSESDIELDLKLGIIAILDEDAQTLGTLDKDLLEAGAAVRGGSLGIPLDVGEAGGQPHQLIRALFLVARHIGARCREQAEHQQENPIRAGRVEGCHEK